MNSSESLDAQLDDQLEKSALEFKLKYENYVIETERVHAYQSLNNKAAEHCSRGVALKATNPDEAKTQMQKAVLCYTQMLGMDLGKKDNRVVTLCQRGVARVSKANPGIFSLFI